MHMPNSLLKFKFFSWIRGFVKMSAICFSVLMKINCKLFLATSSLRKWCLISMCFIFECWIEFLDKLIALVLSHRIRTLSRSILKLRIWCLIHKTWDLQLPTATYSASAVDKAIECCFLEAQEIRQSLRIDNNY